jgi:hypothetical protein
MVCPIEFASSRFRDGIVPDVRTVWEYAAHDLATTFEIEQWNSNKSSRRSIARSGQFREFMVAAALSGNLIVRHND